MNRQSTSQNIKLHDLRGLPSLFVIKNLFHFRWKFYGTVVNGLLIGVFSFAQAYLINDAINNFETLTIERLFRFYLPISIGIILVPEILGYWQRRYGETLGEQYSAFLQLSAARQLLRFSSYPLINTNKEKLHRLIATFAGDTKRFCEEMEWTAPPLLSQITLAWLVLLNANPYLLLFNISYMVAFFGLGYLLSKRYEQKWQKYLHADVAFAATQLHGFLNINSIRELRRSSLFSHTTASLLDKKNQRHNNVKAFHAKRWVIQLSLYGILQIVVLGASLYLIIQGSLEPGFIVLAYWAFQIQWNFMQYNLENFVTIRESLTNGRELEKELQPSSPTNFQMIKPLQQTTGTNYRSKTFILNAISCRLMNSL